jgi:hypothetical protein
VKLSWHFQQLTPWAAALVNAEYVKVMDPPEENLFPESKVIGRFTLQGDGDQIEDSLWRKGKDGADEYFALLQQRYEKRPWVHAWEAVNEPHPRTQQEIQTFVAFTLRWVELMKGRGYKTVGLSLAEGWPEMDVAKHYQDCLTELDYVGLHEYGAPTMQSGASWHCLRYRRTVEQWEDVVAVIPPLLITECGIDGGAASPPQPRKGWKTFATEEQYWQQLLWYDSELQKDAYVKAAFIFTSGPFPDWNDFDFNEALSRRLHDAIAAVVVPPGYESHYVLMAQNVPDSWRRALEKYFDRYKVTNGQSHDDAMIVHGARHHISLVGSPDCQYGVSQELEDHITSTAPEILIDRMVASTAEELKQVADWRVDTGRRFG